jgi:hypothetical protein
VPARRAGATAFVRGPFSLASVFRRFPQLPHLIPAGKEAAKKSPYRKDTGVPELLLPRCANGIDETGRVAGGSHNVSLNRVSVPVACHNAGLAATGRIFPLLFRSRPHVARNVAT